MGIRGFADIKKDIMTEINGALDNKKGISLSKRLTLSKHCLFNTDEENKEFTEAMEKVNGIVQLITNLSANVDNNVVPLQGQPWIELSRLLKTKERLFNITTSIQKEILDKENELDKDRMLFTNYLKINLDDISRTVPPGVMSMNKIAEIHLVEAPLGFETSLRECGQLYEALRAKKDF
ncbi:unnamed protein product [Mytilus edulis]|uniref:Uncharacterized protein n=1 Tax=Mytilus edulis TaxID=6550 RepID=A0A8S3TK88_MYTED|nr:unnamed protein product [Mytilus edulis]